MKYKWDSNGSNRHNCLNNFICECCAHLNLETNFNKGNQFWREGLLNVTHLLILRPINCEWLMIVKVNDPNCICWHSIKPLFLHFIIVSDVPYLQNRHTHPHDESWFWHLSISESFVKSMYVIVMQPLLSWRIGTIFRKNLIQSWQFPVEHNDERHLMLKWRENTSGNRTT